MSGSARSLGLPVGRVENLAPLLFEVAFADLETAVSVAVVVLTVSVLATQQPECRATIGGPRVALRAH